MFGRKHFRIKLFIDVDFYISFLLQISDLLSNRRFLTRYFENKLHFVIYTSAVWDKFCSDQIIPKFKTVDSDKKKSVRKEVNRPYAHFLLLFQNYTLYRSYFLLRRVKGSPQFEHRSARPVWWRHWFSIT